MSRRQHMLTVLAATVAALTVAACSGSGAGDAKAVTPTTRRTIPPISLDSSGMPVVPDEGVGPILSECGQAAYAYSRAFTRAGLLYAGGTDADFDKVRAQFTDLHTKIPTVLKEPFSVVEQAYLDFAKQARGVDLSTSAGATALAEATRLLDAEPVKAANTKIDGWFRANCGTDTPITSG